MTMELVSREYSVDSNGKVHKVSIYRGNDEDGCDDEEQVYVDGELVDRTPPSNVTYHGWGGAGGR